MVPQIENCVKRVEVIHIFSSIFKCFIALFRFIISGKEYIHGEKYVSWMYDTWN